MGKRTNFQKAKIQDQKRFGPMDNFILHRRIDSFGWLLYCNIYRRDIKLQIQSVARKYVNGTH